MLRLYQWCELIGILTVLAATATQLFYLEPLNRQIEYRLNAFYNQQQGQIIARTVYDNRITLLKELKASEQTIKAAQEARDKLLHHYKMSDGSVADVVMEKEKIEDYLQIIVLCLFAFGTLLTTVGRALEMRRANNSR